MVCMHLAQIAVVFRGRCAPCSSTSDARRIVGDEAHGQLARNEVRGGGMMRQNVENLQRHRRCRRRRECVHAQHDLLAVVVQLRVELEAAALAADA